MIITIRLMIGDVSEIPVFTGTKYKNLKHKSFYAQS